MQTDKFIIKIRLSNGIWICNCTEILKDGIVHYDVDITLPAGYIIKKSYKKGQFRFQPVTLDFLFDRWQFDNDEFREILEEELSNRLVARLL